MTPDGPDVAELERLFAEHRPRLYLTTGGLHNPTGRRPRRRPSIACCAWPRSTTFSFSRTTRSRISRPSLRRGLPRSTACAGWCRSAAPPRPSAPRCAAAISPRGRTGSPQLVDLKLATTMGNSATGAHILHRVLTESGYRRHLDGLRRKLADAMGRTVAEPPPPRPCPLDRAARRHLCVGAPARWRRRRRCRPPRADAEGDVRAGARVQRLRRGARLPALQCLPLRRSARLRGSRRSDRRRSPPRRRQSSACRASSSSLEYDGAPFVGWQRQANGLSVQEALEGAILAMTGERATAHGAGRTDAGVHALGQVAHVDLERDWAPFRLERGAQRAASSPSRGGCRRRARGRRFRRAPQRERPPLSLSHRQSPRAARASRAAAPGG